MNNTTYTPKQIADQLKVSTTTLRRYEEQALIPEVPRKNGNHRLYHAIHVQAFVTIRSLLKGYDIPVVYEVMRKVRKGKYEQALWLINAQQYKIQAEKMKVEEILSMIRNADFDKYKNIKITDTMSIREVAEIAGVNSSAIRHWEKEGLIHAKRNRENGYRIFSEADLRRILVISSLRKTVYYIENMKELLDGLDTQSYAKVEQSFNLALAKLNHQLFEQFRGITELMNFITMYQIEKNDAPQH
jgi:DNA-binding transcriptional MerR regulator